MARNQRRRAQEALFAPAPSTTPPEEEKAAERTETAEKPIPGFIADKIFGPGFNDPKPDAETQKTAFVQDRLIPKDELKDIERKFAEGVSPIVPADIIRDEYCIEPNCTNVPRLLYAILCEVVRGRV